jgi:OTU domain-containing protein 6
MYYAIADQLAILGLMSAQDAATPQATRSAAAAYLRAHADSFMPFVPSILGEDMEGATDDGLMTPEGYNEYCRRVEESGDWGGEIEVSRGGIVSAYHSALITVCMSDPSVGETLQCADPCHSTRSACHHLTYCRG